MAFAPDTPTYRPKRTVFRAIRSEGRDPSGVVLSRDGRTLIVFSVTSFSPYDKRLLEEGLAYFDRPRLACLLEKLGTSKAHRVEALATMLRNCPPEELDEALDIFERATARAARQRDREDDRPADGFGDRRRRYSASAERRAQRRRSS